MRTINYYHHRDQQQRTQRIQRYKQSVLSSIEFVIWSIHETCWIDAKQKINEISRRPSFEIQFRSCVFVQQKFDSATQ